jgi:hypothetical protein
MKHLRFISIFIATLALMFVQAMPAQVDKAAGAAGKTVKTAEKTVKDTAQSATEPAAEKTGKMAPAASQSDIAAAKAQGKVWVNTQTGVYHKSGKWYGTTKQGKFMTEDEATKAGYHAAKGK